MENSNHGDLLRAIRRQIAEARQGFEQQVDGPYECNVCPASYNHSNELLSHVKGAHYRHRFICKDKTCYQVFMKKSELDQHMEEKNQSFSRYKCLLKKWCPEKKVKLNSPDDLTDHYTVIHDINLNGDD